MKRIPSILFLSAFGGGLVVAQMAAPASHSSEPYWQASLTAETNKDYD